MASEVEGKVAALGYIDWNRENKSIGMFYHFDAVKVLATGRYELVPATTLATLQAKLVEKDAEIARLQAERDGDVAKAVAAEREACLQIAADKTTGYCECMGYGCDCGNYDDAGSAGAASAARDIAAAIRTRPALTGESDG
jgi:hypothetical protein